MHIAPAVNMFSVNVFLCLCFFACFSHAKDLAEIVMDLTEQVGLLVKENTEMKNSFQQLETSTALQMAKLRKENQSLKHSLASMKSEMMRVEKGVSYQMKYQETKLPELSKGRVNHIYLYCDCMK